MRCLSQERRRELQGGIASTSPPLKGEALRALSMALADLDMLELEATQQTDARCTYLQARRLDISIDLAMIDEELAEISAARRNDVTPGNVTVTPGGVTACGVIYEAGGGV